jgi:hypothetical protein
MSLPRFVIELGRDPAHRIRQIAALGIDVVHAYPRRAIAEGSPARLQRLLDRGIAAYRLREPCLTITDVTWSARACAAIEPALRAAPDPAAPGYHVVAFIGPVDHEWRAALIGAGLDVVLPLTGYGYVVRATGEQMAAVRERAFVAWTEAFQPAFRLAPSLFRARACDLRPDQVRCDALDGGSLPHGLAELGFFPGEDPEAAAEAAEALGAAVVQAGAGGLLVAVDGHALPALARLAGVRRIDCFEPDGFDNDVSAGIVNVPGVRSSHGLDGAGQRVALMETGVDTGDSATVHADFQGRIDGWIPLRAGANGRDEYGHGTHMAGTILGDGSQSGGTYRGVAPAATLTVLVRVKQANLTLADLNTAFDEAYAAGCRLQNNSWGKGSDSAYTLWSEAIDEFVWEHRDFLPTFSAGNNGRDDGDGGVERHSLRETGAAKNCLCVGGSESDRPNGSTPEPGRNLNYGAYAGPPLYELVGDPFFHDHFSDDPGGMYFKSSRGPAAGGRIKPDAVAPATNILSTKPWDAPKLDDLKLFPAENLELPVGDILRPYYFWLTGTSAATALVTGCLALVRQYLVQQRGHDAPGPHPLPSAALLKAIVVNGAVDLAGQYTPSEAGPAPNPDEGWGRVDVERALFPPATGRIEFSDNPGYALATGENREFAIHVHDATHPLAVTLVWTDAVGASGDVVNELYLRVEAPSGAIHDGDHDSDGATWSYADAIAGGVTNNVQRVVVDTPELGTHTVRVHALNVSQGITPSPRPDLDPAVPVQDFALVVANASGFAAQPVAVVQALDRSGSMDYYGYMDSARRRAEEFVDLLRINDKIGVVSFNHAAGVDHPLALLSSFADKQPAKDAISALASAGATSIGAGVHAAQGQFTDDGLPHAIVLLSDGFGNTPPYAVDPPDGSAAVIDQAFVDSGTVVHTIALGPTADAGRLSAIAAATSGQYYEVAGFSDLHKLHEIYYNLQALTTGGSLMFFASGGAAAGQFDSYAAEIDAETSEAFFCMSFDPADERDEHALDFTLLDPRGTIVGEASHRAQFRCGWGYCFYRVPRPAPGHWKLRVRGAHAARELRRYSVAVLGDSSISMDARVVGDAEAGGERTLWVRLDSRLSRAGFASVRALVSRPSHTVRELLERHADRLAALDLDAAVTKHDNEDLARLARLDRMLAQAGEAGIFVESREETLLRPTAVPGVFQAHLPKPARAGTLTVRIRAHGVLAGRGQVSFTRTATFCVHLSGTALR